MKSKKLEKIGEIASYAPLAAYESAAILGVVGGVITEIGAGVALLTGHHEIARNLAAIGGMGFCIGGIMGVMEAACYGAVSPIDGYQADVFCNRKGLDGLIELIGNYRKSGVSKTISE